MESLVTQQKVDELSWELLLINNNSTDHTPDVAKSYLQKLPMRYIFEPIQGLSAARNRALKEFHGDILVFTDDDVLVDPFWLSEYSQAKNCFPGADFFGGRILPFWKGNRPRWLHDPNLALISGLLVNFDLGEENRWIEDGDPLPFGANFALSRELTLHGGRFRLDLGVSGESVGRGEEADYMQRAQNAGVKAAYLAKAICFHVQDEKRFGLGYLYRFGIEKGRTAALIGIQGQSQPRSQLHFGIKGLFQLLKGRGDRFRQCVINMGIQRGLAIENRRNSRSQAQ